jgi:glutamate N-acetyltransferase/amino-acid N-acetyltransferase
MDKLKFIEGGVCAPIGFRAAGVHCGIRKGRTKKDLALIVSDVQANAAAVYTTNLAVAAPCLVTKENLADGKASAVICNSGIANACASDGMDKARAMCGLVASEFGYPNNDVLVASTGVIGKSIDLVPIERGVAALAGLLSNEGSGSAAEAIMTTDTFKKEVAVELNFDGRAVRIGGIAKGSGMINPNMATMLGFLTTDAEIDADLLKTLLGQATVLSFNRVSVDGDTSTNDMLTVLANGKSGVKIEKGSRACAQFKEGLDTVCVYLAKLLAKDGEGATKLLECKVGGAPSDTDAAQVADSVINSSLVKAAFFGEDANWGRILCAVGYSGAELDISLINITLKSAAGEILVCKGGAGVDFCELTAKEILRQNEIIIDIQLNQGSGFATAWGCDLSYDYVKINGDYRT